MPANVETFEKQGYLVIQDFVDQRACQSLIEAAARIVADFDPDQHRSVFSTTDGQQRDQWFMESGDKIRCFFEEDAFTSAGDLKQDKALSINKIGHALHDLDPVFNTFSRNPRLAKLASDLGMTQPLLLQSMYIFKQPRIGGVVLPHQDNTFLYTTPLSTIGFWFALEDATLENGCLHALPAGHKTGLKSRYFRNKKGGTVFETFDDSPFPETGWVPLEVPAGTLVVLHGSLPHKSEANRSGKSRQAYALHVIDGMCDYAADNWLQRGNHMPLRGF